MPKITINANSETVINTAKKWLEFLSMSDELMLDISGDGRIVARVNKSYDVAQYEQLRLVNENNFPVSVRYENRQTTVNSTGNTAVSLSGPVTIQDIENLVNVAGTVSTKHAVSTTTNSYEDIVMASGEVRHIAAQNQYRKEIFIQVISNNETVLRVGDSDVSNSRGLLLFGSEENPNSIILTHQSDVYLMNTSNSQAKIAVYEVLQ